MIGFIAKLFGKKKPEPKVSGVKHVDVVDKVVDALDKIHASNDDIYSDVALLVSDIKDVTLSSGDNKTKQKEDCLKTLEHLKSRISEM